MAAVVEEIRSCRKAREIMVIRLQHDLRVGFTKNSDKKDCADYRKRLQDAENTDEFGRESHDADCELLKLAVISANQN